MTCRGRIGTWPTYNLHVVYNESAIVLASNRVNDDELKLILKINFRKTNSTKIIFHSIQSMII